MNKHLPFCRGFSVLCTEDRALLNVLSNFERERLLMTQLFDRQGVWPIKYYDLYIALIINLIDLVWHMVWLSYTCGGVLPNKVGQNRETDEEHDEDCVVEGFQSWRMVAWSKKSSLYFENNFPILLLCGISNTSIFKVRDTLQWVNFTYSNIFSCTFCWGR